MAGSEFDHPGVRRSRSVLHARGRFTLADQAFEAELIDLSLSGARFRMPAGFSADDGVPLGLELICGEARSPRLAGRLVRANAENFAVHFEHLGAQDEAALAAFIERHGEFADPIDR